MLVITTGQVLCLRQNHATLTFIMGVNPFSADRAGAEDTPAFTRGALSVWVLYRPSLSKEAGVPFPPGSVGLPYLLHMHLPAQ